MGGAPARSVWLVAAGSIIFSDDCACLVTALRHDPPVTGADRVAQMSQPIIDYRQPRAALADHVSFFYHFRHDGDGFSAVNRAEFAQLRFILSGDDGLCRFVDGTVQAIPAI